MKIIIKKKKFVTKKKHSFFHSPHSIDIPRRKILYRPERRKTIFSIHNTISIRFDLKLINSAKFAVGFSIIEPEKKNTENKPWNEPCNNVIDKRPRSSARKCCLGSIQSETDLAWKKNTRNVRFNRITFRCVFFVLHLKLQPTRI